MIKEILTAIMGIPRVSTPYLHQVSGKGRNIYIYIYGLVKREISYFMDNIFYHDTKKQAII
jgi:hypothetical protein